jgi:hypothetical protein
MVKGKRKIILTSCLICLSILFGIQSVHAAASIKISDGINTPIVIADGSGSDSNAATGVITWIGSIGVFDINVTTGSTKPVLGSATLPELDLNNLSINSTGSGNLWVEFSDTGFGPLPPSYSSFITTVGGTSDDTTEFFSYVDASNTLFGTATQVGNLGPYVAGQDNDPFSGVTSGSASPSSPFSMTSVAKITHGSDGMNTSFNLNVVVVPEPLSSSLFIVGAATLGFRRFRKKFKK